MKKPALTLSAHRVALSNDFLAAVDGGQEVVYGPEQQRTNFVLPRDEERDPAQESATVTPPAQA